MEGHVVVDIFVVDRVVAPEWELVEGLKGWKPLNILGLAVAALSGCTK